MRQKHKIMYKKSAPVLNSPRDGSIIKHLRYGETVTVLSDEHWLRVRLPDNTIGFVSSNLVEFAPPSTSDKIGYFSFGQAGEEPLDNRSSPYVGRSIVCAREFAEKLDQLGKLANESEMRLWVISSLVEPDAPIDCALENLGKLSSQYTGHGIAVDIEHMRADGVNSHFYTGEQLATFKAGPSLLSDPVREFLKDATDNTGLEWGGASQPNLLHDNHADRSINDYQKLLVELWGKGILKELG